MRSLLTSTFRAKMQIADINVINRCGTLASENPSPQWRQTENDHSRDDSMRRFVNQIR